MKNYDIVGDFALPTGSDGDSVYTSGPATAYICSPTYHHGLRGEVCTFLYHSSFKFPLIISQKLLMNFNCIILIILICVTVSISVFIFMCV